MKLLFDLLPILLFFVAYKFLGIFYATAILMAASILQVGGYWLKHRRFEMMHIITLVAVLILGGITLLLHNDLFIKWKPTIIYWAFALFFLGSQFIGNKPIIQRMMEDKFQLPKPVWQRLNWGWTLFFTFLGIVNLYVAYHFSTNIWVNFKLFGSMGLILIFAVAEALYIAKHTENKPEKNP